MRLTFFLRCTSTKVRFTQILYTILYNSTGKVTYWKAELRLNLKHLKINEIKFKSKLIVLRASNWTSHGSVLWTILHCIHMPLGWPSPVVCPSWSLALAKPADHTLSSINIFQTWPLILIRSSTVSEWRDALVQCFSNFKLKSLSS